jgi:hypothetical protein
VPLDGNPNPESGFTESAPVLMIARDAQDAKLVVGA